MIIVYIWLCLKISEACVALNPLKIAVLEVYLHVAHLVNG